MLSCFSTFYEGSEVDATMAEEPIREEGLEAAQGREAEKERPPKASEPSREEPAPAELSPAERLAADVGPDAPAATPAAYSEPIPHVAGGFSTVLADPPWRFQNRTGKVAPEHKRLNRYQTMALEDIKALPVEEACAENAHLYLWVPNALLPEGLEVMEAWGFRYVTNIVWAKRRKDGGPDGRGVGFYFRNVTELLLFGVKGHLRTLAPARSQVNMIETRKREHSRKPDEQYALIESCSPGPYLELFARYPQPHWTSWGTEAAADVVPQGKQYKGYEGGEIEIPHVEPNERLPEDVALAIGQALRKEYEAGESITSLAAKHDFSIQRTRSLLLKAGTEFRKRGPQAKAQDASAREGAAEPQDAKNLQVRDAQESTAEQQAKSAPAAENDARRKTTDTKADMTQPHAAGLKPAAADLQGATEPQDAAQADANLQGARELDESTQDAAAAEEGTGTGPRSA